jgi:hypothetical protein
MGFNASETEVNEKDGRTYDGNGKDACAPGVYTLRRPDHTTRERGSKIVFTTALK